MPRFTPTTNHIPISYSLRRFKSPLLQISCVAFVNLPCASHDLPAAISLPTNVMCLGVASVSLLQMDQPPRCNPSGNPSSLFTAYVASLGLAEQAGIWHNGSRLLPPPLAQMYNNLSSSCSLLFSSSSLRPVFFVLPEPICWQPFIQSFIVSVPTHTFIHFLYPVFWQDVSLSSCRYPLLSFSICLLAKLYS